MAFVLAANRQRVEDAKAALKKFDQSSVEDRIKEAKLIQDDEYASMAGVVTLTQAEASFIDLMVYAYDDMADSFAEFVPLSIGEIPVYKVQQEYPIRVNMGHLAGGPPAVKYTTAQTGVQVVPFQYFSEEFLVPNLVNVSFDIAKFHIKEKALARLARDMKLFRQQIIINTMLNQPLTQSLTLSLSTYYASTPFLGRNPYVLDPAVVTGSIATTNIISAITEGGLTANLFKLIHTQLILQGRSPKNMYIPIAGTPWQAYWNQASVIAYTATGTANPNQNTDPIHAIPPSKWEEIVNTGFSENGQYMNWFGMNIFVQPTNILPVGYFLISTNLPAVLGWNQLDAAISDEDPLTGSLRMMSKRYEARSIALAQPDPLVLNYAMGRYI